MSELPASAPVRHSVTPHLIVPSSVEAIAFYEKAFGAVLLHRVPGPDGSTMHAQIAIGDSIVMMVDENPDWGLMSPRTLGANTSSCHLTVPDADRAFQRAVDAGCRVRHPLGDMFWGDRFGQVTDPFGHDWGIASPLEALRGEELDRRAVEVRRQTEQTPGASCDDASPAGSACGAALETNPAPSAESPLLVYNEDDLERPSGGCCGWVAN